MVPLVHVVTARVMAILSQLAILIGTGTRRRPPFRQHQNRNCRRHAVLAAAYTAMWTGSVTHALPGALLVWAIVFYAGHSWQVR